MSVGLDELEWYYNQLPKDPGAMALAASAVEIMLRYYRLSRSSPDDPVSPFLELTHPVHYLTLIDSFPPDAFEHEVLPRGTEEYPEARLKLTAQEWFSFIPRGSELYLSGVLFKDRVQSTS